MAELINLAIDNPFEIKILISVWVEYLQALLATLRIFASKTLSMLIKTAKTDDMICILNDPVSEVSD